MFGLTAIPWKLVGFAAIAAILGFILWHDHHISRLYQAQKAKTAEQSERADTAEAQTRAEREARKREHDANEKVDQQLLAANQALELERSKPLPHLSCRLRIPTTNLPGADSAASVDHAAAEGHDSQPDAADPLAEFDPSEQLLQFAVEAQQNRDGWAACQTWVREAVGEAAPR